MSGDYESFNVDDDTPEKAPTDPRRFDGFYDGGFISNVDIKTITKWARMVKRQFGIEPDIGERQGTDSEDV
jgi:hypothetical protein